MRKILLYFFLLVSLTTNANAPLDSLNYKSLKDFFQKGKISGNTRLFFMATDNSHNLKDYYGLGFGSGIAYQTPNYQGFQAGMSGFFILDLKSSNFSELDPSTNNPSRYELGLFDLENLNNRHNMARVEQLYLKYTHKKTSILWGQFLPKFSFINGQDGRMSPTFTRGLLFETKSIKNITLQLAWLTAFAPRSTIKWYSVAESMGIYPMGVNENGTKSNYKGNTTSKGVGIFNISHKPIKSLTLKFEDYFVENVFNTALIQTEFNHNGWFAGVMGVAQQPINNGGNADQTKTYFGKSSKSYVFSSRIGKKFGNWQTNLSYTRITKEGRFLMPREWGREPFYTFTARERNEGAGNVNAVTLGVSNLLLKNLSINVIYGKFYLPDVKTVKLNKYGLPSYDQLNIELNYKFKNALDGLSTQILYVRKNSIGNTYQSDKYIFNKVDLNLFNWIVNFNF